MRFIFLIYFLFSIGDATNIKNICLTKVVLNWDKNVTYLQKEKVIFEASVLNYEKERFFNGEKNLLLADGFETRNKFKWLYFLFKEDKCQYRITNTKKILKIFFEPVKGFPSYKIIGQISEQEKRWVIKYLNTVEFRSRITNSNGSVEVGKAKTIPIPKGYIKSEKER